MGNTASHVRMAFLCCCFWGWMGDPMQRMYTKYMKPGNDLFHDPYTAQAAPRWHPIQHILPLNCLSWHDINHLKSL